MITYKPVCNFLVTALSAISLASPILSETTNFEVEVNPAYSKGEIPPPDNNALLAVFEDIPEQEGASVSLEVLNGIRIDRRHFPTVFAKNSAGHPECTATLIGPGAALTAAHCVDDNPYISLVRPNGPVKATCYKSSLWTGNSNSGADVAVCILATMIRDISPESVSFTLPNVGDDLALMGFGATNLESCKRKISTGDLNLGFAPAARRPPGMPNSPGTMYTVSNLPIEELIVLCPGDSGGPLMKIGGLFTDPRKILAVNSGTTFELGVSTFAALGAPHNEAFLRAFTNPQTIGLEICGINKFSGCRG